MYQQQAQVKNQNVTMSLQSVLSPVVQPATSVNNMRSFSSIQENPRQQNGSLQPADEAARKRVAAQNGQNNQGIDMVIRKIQNAR